jgi:hypothetical protein
MSTLPPLPKIDGDVDLMLDVYTHSSLRQAGVTRMNENYGDTLRLEDLGAKVLDLSVTVHLYNERPAMNTVEDMKASRALNGSGLSRLLIGLSQTKRTQFTSFATIDSWLDSYGLKNKLRMAPSEINTVLNDPQVITHDYFP